MFVDLEKIQPEDTLVVNFEILKLHLCMDYCEVLFSKQAGVCTWYCMICLMYIRDAPIVLVSTVSWHFILFQYILYSFISLGPNLIKIK